VPTPIDKYKQPDLTPLIKASETIGKVLKVGDIVIYESTVYPGATEEDCVPVLEKFSGLTFNQDFFAGYSPERINPGDKEHRVTTIKKVTSGSTPAAVNQVYNVAVGERTSLRKLYQLIAASLSAQCTLQASNLIHRDFRAGDVRHSLADISKAQTLLGYSPTIKVGTGITAAMPWYIYQVGVK
jgi:hypothetical protein